MSDLGDLTGFFKDASAISDLDWLDVDEKEYRALDRLPKQNLDIAPDLEAIWRHKDEPASNFVPNTGEPRTMGDLSEMHGRLRSAPEDLIRTARLALVQTTDPKKIHNILTTRYDGTVIAASKEALSEVFTERGLLGRLYINASDFPNCTKGSSEAEFVRKFASEAKFVVAKEACAGCSNRHVDAAGCSHCGVFHKEIQVEVPYSDGLATEVEQQQLACGKNVQASKDGPKERIRKAFLATSPSAQGTFSGHNQVAPVKSNVTSGQALIAAENLTKKRNATEKAAMEEIKARPIVALLRREMLKGRGIADITQSLRLAFDIKDLEATKAVWGPVYKEAGLYGAVYITQDSFDDCREGADFIHKHASKARAVVAGEKCSSCIFHQASRCMMYGRKLIASAGEVITTETVQAVIDEGRIAGKLPYDAANRHWGATPAEALKAIHKAASTPLAQPGMDVRALTEKAFYGKAHVAQTNTLVKRDILRTASRFMNEGLYGVDLLEALSTRFGANELKATAQELKIVLVEQGLQGIKYIDPTVYEDYGNGCKEASRLHRSRTAVKYVKLGSKCESCVHQSCAGKCSALNKALVSEPPYVDKLAEQRAILASGKSTEISYGSLMNNGLSMMQEYQLQHQSSEFELNEKIAADDSWIEFGNAQEFKL